MKTHNPETNCNHIALLFFLFIGAQIAGLRRISQLHYNNIMYFADEVN